MAIELATGTPFAQTWLAGFLQRYGCADLGELREPRVVVGDLVKLDVGSEDRTVEGAHHVVRARAARG